MRDTIRKEPEMFFSYNNGLSATADSVEIADLGASAHVSCELSDREWWPDNRLDPCREEERTGATQGRVCPDEAHRCPAGSPEEIVPSISRSANSQNKVNATDFFANHPFHIRMQEFSRRVCRRRATADTGKPNGFTRGPGAVRRREVSAHPGRTEKFEAQFPKEQFFTKVDLAKFENSYRCKPNIVSLGAEKNFGDFAKVIGTEWGKDGESFDEIWFRRLVAKGIIFRNLERLVPAQPWYVKGYRANIVTYAFAKVVHDAEQLKRVVDLDQVWRLQRVPVVLERALIAAAEMANEVIATPLLVCATSASGQRSRPAGRSLRSARSNMKRISSTPSSIPLKPWPSSAMYGRNARPERGGSSTRGYAAGRRLLEAASRLRAVNKEAESQGDRDPAGLHGYSGQGAARMAMRGGNEDRGQAGAILPQT
jgi:hypothetical protein